MVINLDASVFVVGADAAFSGLCGGSPLSTGEDLSSGVPFFSSIRVFISSFLIRFTSFFSSSLRFVTFEPPKNLAIDCCCGIKRIYCLGLKQRILIRSIQEG